MSRSRNLQAHKVAYNEIARCLAEGGYQVLSSALHQGIIHPNQDSLSAWLASNAKPNLGFYGFFTKLDSGTAQSLNHGEVTDLIPNEHRKIIKNFEAEYPGAEFDFSISLDSQQLHENIILMDPKEKIIDLSLTVSCIYKGTRKSVTGSRKIKVYSLLSPIISKFTYYHKGYSGNRYNRFVSNIYGRPAIRPDGKFKYEDDIAPLVLINGPLDPKSEFIPDSILLEARGSKFDPSSFDHLADFAKIEKSRKEILRRGFLYFGPESGASNVLNLTPGLDPIGYGEYFNLFNPFFGDGSRTYPAIQFMNLPEAFNNPVPVTNRMLATEGVDFLTNGRAEIHTLYEGFYESDATNAFAPNPANGGQLKTGYSGKSSLIHPFGTYTAPSRAYTVGSAYRAVAKISSIGIDRDESNYDESNQSKCLPSPAPRRDATSAYLFQVEETEFLNPQVGYTLDPIKKSLDNRNYVPGCQEPKSIQLPTEFDYPLLFPTYEQYRLHMSDVILIPMNHLIDFVHYSQIGRAHV